MDADIVEHAQPLVFHVASRFTTKWSTPRVGSELVTSLPQLAGKVILYP